MEIEEAQKILKNCSKKELKHLFWLKNKYRSEEIEEAIITLQREVNNAYPIPSRKTSLASTKP